MPDNRAEALTQAIEYFLALAGVANGRVSRVEADPLNPYQLGLDLEDPATLKNLRLWAAIYSGTLEELERLQVQIEVEWPRITPDERARVERVLSSVRKGVMVCVGQVEPISA